MNESNKESLAKRPDDDKDLADRAGELDGEDLESVTGGVIPLHRPRSSSDPQEGGEIA